MGKRNVKLFAGSPWLPTEVYAYACL